MLAETVYQTYHMFPHFPFPIPVLYFASRNVQCWLSGSSQAGLCQVLTPDFIDSKSIGGVIEIVAVVESNLKMESHKLLASIVVISSLSRIFPHAPNVKYQALILNTCFVKEEKRVAGIKGSLPKRGAIAV